MQKFKIKLFAIISIAMIIGIYMSGFHLCEKDCKTSEEDDEIVEDENTQGTTWLVNSKNELEAYRY